MDDAEAREDGSVAACSQLLDPSEAAISVDCNKSSVDENVIVHTSVSSNEASRGLIVRSECCDGSETDVGYLEDSSIVHDPQLSGTTTGFLEEEIVDISPSGFPLSVLRKVSPKNQLAAARVKQIYVFDNTFTVLPPSIIHFKGLQSLKLFSNEVKLLPKEIGHLADLQQLHVKVCPPSLENFVPLSKISGLRTLELHQIPQKPSALTLPVQLLELQTLTRLSICHFSISFLPPEIGALKNLEELDLSFNKLKVLPKEVSGLRQLKDLRVASNRLSELPFELSYLPNLENIDAANNRITSLVSLNLTTMKSLKSLNVQFNRIEAIGELPKHLKCSVEGNEQVYLPNVEDEPLRFDSKFQFEEVATKTCLPMSRGNSVNGGGYMKANSDCKRQDTEQQKNPQGQFDDSISPQLGDVAMPILVSEEAMPFCRKGGNTLATDMNIEGSNQNNRTACHRHAYSETKGLSVSCQHSEKSDSDEFKSQPHCDCGNQIKKESELKKESKDEYAANSKFPQDVRITEDRCSADERICGSFSIDGACRQVAAQCAHSHDNQGCSASWEREKPWKERKAEKICNQEHIDGRDFRFSRNRSSKVDINPKPCKRRKSIDTCLAVSYKYCKESFCGFQDRLNDGFYDAGRDRPFMPLHVLEEEQPSVNSREVILVDRERDEDLDAIAMSAKQLLTVFSEKELIDNVPQEQRGVKLQKVSLLALYVSDCFGGSDKACNIIKMRRAALGDTAGSPFMCSCGMEKNASAVNKDGDTSGASAGLLPNLQMLCNLAVRYLKSKRGSNVLPIGSLSYGVCRHRAILFKYLCDRSVPVIPCELVRGYLDYIPHAWNVALVWTGDTSERMLVDACRPFDIRPEIDPEYFCRYIPFKRICLPKQPSESAASKNEETISPTFLEEIGQGASGAVVRRCTFGSLIAAAKVRRLTEAEVSGGLASCLERRRWLSELQILSSVGEHPSIVKFYGHELSLGGSSCNDDDVPVLKIYMEYVAGSSLEAFLKLLANEGQSHMHMQLALYVAQSISGALVWLHSRGIVHRDIKSSNILIDFDPDGLLSSTVVKLCDFDSAVYVRSSPLHSCYLAHHGLPLTDMCVGTPRWLAPEVLNAMYSKHPYGLEADMWSFGCLLVELLTLDVPYAGSSDTEVHSCIQCGQRPEVSSELWNRSKSCNLGSLGRSDNDIQELLLKIYERCTDATPSRRLSAVEAFSMLSAVAESIEMSTPSSAVSKSLKNPDPSTEKVSLSEQFVGKRHCKKTLAQENENCSDCKVHSCSPGDVTTTILLKC